MSAFLLLLPRFAEEEKGVPQTEVPDWRVGALRYIRRDKDFPMPRSLMSFFLVCLLSAGAAADPKPAGNEPLAAEAVKAELLGVRMSGVVVQTGQTWAECIEPGGRTLYEIGDYISEGMMEITANGQACFTYPGTGTSCFRGQRAPKGYMFYGIGGGGVFHANKVERGVKKCIARDLIG